MTKSIKNNKAIYNFLDNNRLNLEISSLNKNLIIADYIYGIMLNINQETANELIKVLNEFVDAGELK
jgi:hypothetical protein